MGKQSLWKRPEGTNVKQKGRVTPLMGVYVFGSNLMGQLGLSISDESDNRRGIVCNPFFEGIRVKSAHCGYIHAFVITEDGELYSFGCNDEGALGRGGREDEPNIVKLPGKVVKACGGGSISLALLENGDLYSWGTFRNSHGLFGFSPTVSIQSEPALILKRISDISCGKNFCAVLDTQGNIITFGVGDDGELGYRRTERMKKCLIPRIITSSYKKKERFRKVVCGGYHAGAISKDGTLFMWGMNNADQLGVTALEGSGIVENDPDELVSNGNDAFQPLLPLFKSRKFRAYRRRIIKPIIGGVRDISLGMFHTHVLLEDGRTLAFGYGEFGQLGTDSLVMERKFSQIRSRVDFSIGEDEENKLYSWGPSNFMEAGYEGEEHEPKPIDFNWGEKVIDFDVGCDFSIVLTRSDESPNLQTSN